MLFFRTKITVPKEDWTNEDSANMRELVAHPYFNSMLKLLCNRLNTRIDELIDSEDTRPQIQELSDLLLELKNYADPS